MLDQQVVRAALKSYRRLLSSKAPSIDLLSPSSYYLRLLLTSERPPTLTASSWLDPGVTILLLEWRAALIVQNLAQNSNQPDASAYQRVSKATTEAFAAVQIGHMILGLNLRDKEKAAVSGLYRLVGDRG